MNVGPPPGKFAGRLSGPQVCAVDTRYRYLGPGADLAQLERDGRLVRLPAGTRVRWLEMDQPFDWWHSATRVKVTGGRYRGAECFIAGTGPLVR